MFKRISAIFISILLCMSIPTMTASAANAAFPAWGALSSEDEVDILLNKTVYAPGERIAVITLGITQQMVADKAFVGVYAAGSAHDEYGDWYYPKSGTNKGELRAPKAHGSYEVRLYRKEYIYTDETFVMKVPFTVADLNSDNPGKIELEKDTYPAGSRVPVKVSGITGEMAKDRAVITICPKGAEHARYGYYGYPEAGDSTVGVNTPNLNGDFEVRLYAEDNDYSDSTLVMSVPFKLSGAISPTASNWARAELEKAEVWGLIPDTLKKADQTKPITRADFAAVSVRVYESLSGRAAIAAAANPFSDTEDVEVLKAYNIGITDGMGDGKFAPYDILNREQAVTMLTRVFKKVSMPGWTLAADSQFTLTYTKPAPFADDANISGWAKDSVYFMAASGIIDGVGKNMFAPRPMTPAEESKNYARATREQALLIAVRMVENLK